MFEINRLAGYGIIDWTDSGFQVFTQFWQGFLKPAHVSYDEVGGGYKNLILLVEISPTRLDPAVNPPLENIFLPIYTKTKQERIDREKARVAAAS